MKKKATKAYAPDLPRRRQNTEEDVATEEGSQRRALIILIALSWGTRRSYVVVRSICQMVAQKFARISVNCLRLAALALDSHR